MVVDFIDREIYELNSMQTGYDDRAGADHFFRRAQSRFFTKIQVQRGPRFARPGVRLNNSKFIHFL